MIKEHDKSQEKDDSCHSGQLGKRIAQRRKLFLIFCIAAVFLIAIIVWESRSFWPSASESASGSKPTFMVITPLTQQAIDYLRIKTSETIEQLTNDFPGNINISLLSARFHFKNKDCPAAKLHLEESLKNHPAHPLLLTSLGKVAFANAEYSTAVKHWEKVLEISVYNSNLYNQLLTALIFLGKYNDVIEHGNRVNPSQHSERSYYLVGQAYLLQGNYAKAKEYYEKVLEINPKHPEANHGLVKVYMRLKQPDKADHHLKIYKEFKADWLRDWNKISKRTNPIIRDITTPDELKEFPEIFAKLCIEGGKLYKKKKDSDKALKLLNKGENTFSHAIKLAPEAPDIYREFASFYLGMNQKPAEAKELAKRAVALEGSAKNYHILCKVLYRNLDLPNALKALEKALELEPDNLLYKRLLDEINRNK